jgi:hypothetical protein
VFLEENNSSNVAKTQFKAKYRIESLMQISMDPLASPVEERLLSLTLITLRRSLLFKARSGKREREIKLED